MQSYDFDRLWMGKAYFVSSSFGTQNGHGGVLRVGLEVQVVNWVADAADFPDGCGGCGWEDGYCESGLRAEQEGEERGEHGVVRWLGKRLKDDVCKTKKEKRFVHEFVFYMYDCAPRII
jgi:hypothetical protein